MELTFSISTFRRSAEPAASVRREYCADGLNTAVYQIVVYMVSYVTEIVIDRPFRETRTFDRNAISPFSPVAPETRTAFVHFLSPHIIPSNNVRNNFTELTIK